MAATKTKQKRAPVNRTLDTEQIVRVCERFKIAPDATTFVPEYLDRVYVLGPGTGAQPVSPGYCLSLPSAIGLCYILRDLEPTIWMGDPNILATGSPFQYSEQVAWATFIEDGAEVDRNLGTLAFYWNANSGDPGGHTAERNCRTDIACG